jgi:hypothetical protein
MRVAGTLDELIALSHSNTNELVKYEIGTLPEKQAEWIFEILKLSIRNFTIVVDNYAVKHIINKHGNPVTEIPRGQIAVIPHDFTQLPGILYQPDKCSYIGVNRLKNHIFLYEKTGMAHYCCLLELRAKRKELAVQTLYKRKAPTTM